MTDTISAFFQNDHREIDAILERVAFGYPPEALEAFQEFHERLERHIHWEEGILFPAVASKAPPLAMGPIRVMKMEHEEIRKHKAAALDALKKGDGESARTHSDAMLGVLKEHNAKEEQVLYPACDQLLSSAETQAILAEVRNPAQPGRTERAG